MTTSKSPQVSRERHGLSGSPEYKLWANMKKRCYNKNTADYLKYGARGIQIYDEWRNSFKAFYAYIGPRPAGRYSLDRINNDGNYEPGNVRWATYTEQERNRRPRKSASGQKGIYFDKRYGNWKAAIVIQNKYIHLGSFADIKDAIKAHEAAQAKYWGMG